MDFLVGILLFFRKINIFIERLLLKKFKIIVNVIFLFQRSRLIALPFLLLFCQLNLSS